MKLHDQPLLDAAVIADLDDLGGGVLAEVVTLYFSEAAKQVVEMRFARGRAEMLLLAQTAHRLKGGSAAAGASHIARVARDLEATALSGDLPAVTALLESLPGALEATREAFRERASTPIITPTKGPT